jgi:mannose-6-phosphate isomerase class I
LNALVYEVHAGGLTATAYGTPQMVEIIAASTNSAKTYLWVKLKDKNYTCEYGDEKSKAWLEMIELAMINKKQIFIRFDPDYKTTFTWCADFNSAGSCTATGLIDTAEKIMAVHFY